MMTAARWSLGASKRASWLVIDRAKIGKSNRLTLEIVSMTSVRSLSSASVEVKAHPELKVIPSLPIVGSLVSAYSGLPPLYFDDINRYWRANHKKYGPFYSVGMPGFGSGLFGTVYFVRDPHEMLKVIKQEGACPSGLLPKMWSGIAWLADKKYTSKGLFQRGAEWKRIRNFLQKDLLAPASAREYLPGVIQGAAEMSPQAPTYLEKNQLHRFLNTCSLNMFMHVLFGGKRGMTEEDFLTFRDSAVEGLHAQFDLVRSPYETVLNKLGWKTDLFRKFASNFDILDEIARRRFEGFRVQMENNDLSEEERNSYVYKMLHRQPESDVKVSEVVEIAIMLMIAAVDTTAAKLSWNILQLALNPKEQEKLYVQIAESVHKNGGLTPDALDRSEIPLLAACIRETHRCTPAIFADINKQVAVPTEVYGRTLPAGSSIIFDGITDQWDPSIVDEPMEFRPGRWLKENVEARKNTPAALIDHPFYSGPFSQGARKCPGSRVANLEIHALLAQLLLDWQIEGPSMHWDDVASKLQTLLVPNFPDGIRFVPRK